MIYKKGVHRPLVAGVQNVIGASIDGFWGDETEKLIQEWHADRELPYAGFLAGEGLKLLFAMMPLSAKIFEVIAVCEVGSVRNAWAARGKITDGAGINYGPLQVNRLGSASMLAQYKPDGVDFSEWASSPEGAAATLKWFEAFHMDRARNIALNVMHSTEDRAIGLAVDAIVQGGFPPQNHVYLWADLPEGENWELFKARAKSLYDRKNVKPQVSFQESIEHGRLFGLDPVDMFAELHPRSGQSRYLGDQLSRRRLWARGEGYVHGEFLRLADFGIG